MRQIKRYKVLLIMLTVIAAAFVWYYFDTIYNKKDSMHGTLVENIQEQSATGSDSREQSVFVQSFPDWEAEL